MKAADLFSLPQSLPFGSFFDPEVPPWEWVGQIAEALQSFSWPANGSRGTGALHIEGPVFIHPSVRLPHQATILGPVYIGAGTEIRPGAYLRGNVIVGEGCVLGHACEFKNALLMDGVQVPHFSYVGDSVLGSGSHLGAGVILSNLRLDQGPVPVVVDGERRNSGRTKLGALIGERAEVGCNAVLQPGTILGRRAMVMPAMAFGGTLAAGEIAKTRVSVVTLPSRD
jgi:UDP-N-acetylglucosamine diphosphorylase / glucose-1-phosphate thymidylyltransferase / UDP-N-acetylgalactosamine diphosphorylase / glucosamine-1-phosphate N-acetyltransferase / galactosamine-1-phosphate N-acetyltransferase